jgi:sulfur-oxidizing protein SoxX
MKTLIQKHSSGTPGWKTASMALLGAACLMMLASCASPLSDAEATEQALAMMKSGFKERGQAKLDRLEQDEAQKICSRAADAPALDKAAEKRIEESNLKAVKFPADGKLLGDWREGERIAQSGIGKQFTDNPATPSGANCYACHQLSPTELSFGTIGPPLLGYGKIRAQIPDIAKYTYTKIYNPQAYTACSNMPRFGHNQILTEAQITHVVALLLDPNSPVNK